MWLKQSTVQVILFGPFLDKGNGVDLETGLLAALDHATTGIMLAKNGGTLAVREQGANFVASTYDSHGCYKVSLSAIDTETLGRLRVIYTDPTTNLPVWQDFMVVPAAVWDALFGSGHLDVNVLTQANIDFGALQKASLNAATPASVQNIPATGSGFTALGDTRIANLDATVSSRAPEVAGNVAAIKSDVEHATYGLNALLTAIGTRMATFTYTVPDSPAAIAAAVWAYVVEGTLTALNTVRILLSALSGKSDGIGTPTVHTRDISDTKNRITATIDAFGDRTDVTLDGS